MPLPHEFSRAQEQRATIDTTDAFGYQKTAPVTPVIGLLAHPEVSQLRSRTQTSGSGSISADASEITLSTGTTSGSTTTLDTQQWGRYIPGHAGVYGIRVQLPSKPTSDQEIKWGAFNDNNGIIWGFDNTGLFLQIRDGGTDSNKIRQSDFNGVVPTSFDVTNSIIYRNPFTFYGAGSVQFELFFSNAGANVREVIHTITPDQKDDIGLTSDGSSLFEQPNFPVRCVVDNGTTTTDVKANVIGRQFDVIGKYDPARRSISETVEGVSIGTSDTTIMNWTFKSNWRPIEVKFDNIKIINGSEEVELKVLFDTSVSGASFSAPSGIPSSETPVQVDTDGSHSGGARVDTDIIKGAGSGNQEVRASLEVQPLPFPKFTNISLVGQSLTGSSSTADINMSLRAEM